MKSGTEAEVKAWVVGTKPYDWYNRCAGLAMSICRHFGNVPPLGVPTHPVYATARLAYEAALATGKLERDSSKARPGWFHYWDYTTTIGGVRKNYGHVVVDMRGGGTHTLSATKRADPMWGKNAGLISVRQQTTAIGSAGRYLGCAPTYGRAWVANIITDTPVPEEDEVPDIIAMSFAQTKPQVFEKDAASYLRLNDEGHVTVASGPRVVGNGVLSISGRAVGSGPFDTEGFVPVLQVQPVIDTVEGGKTRSSSLGGLVEITITQGVTAGQVAVPPVTLKANQHLRFKVTLRARDKFTLGSTSVRLALYDAPGK